MTIKWDTKWGFQKLYNFGVSFCREQRKKDTRDSKVKQIFSCVPESHIFLFPHTRLISVSHTHTHTHILVCAPLLLSPLTDSEGRWRTYPLMQAVSSSFDAPPCHLRPSSRLPVTFSSVTLPTWLHGTDITIQKWATTLPSLQRARSRPKITQQLKVPWNVKRRAIHDVNDYYHLSGWRAASNVLYHHHERVWSEVCWVAPVNHFQKWCHMSKSIYYKHKTFADTSIYCKQLLSL